MEGHQELSEGLGNMGSMIEVARQINRCLDFACRTAAPGTLSEVILHLQTTIDVLHIGKDIVDSGVFPLGEATLYVTPAAQPVDLNWKDWFKRTQWSILSQFIRGSMSIDQGDFDLLTRKLQGMVEGVLERTRRHGFVVEMVETPQDSTSPTR